MEAGGITRLKEIKIESVSFTAAEVCRAALEFAGGRRWLQFDNAEVKVNLRKASFNIVQSCMVGRHDGVMDLLIFLNQVRFELKHRGKLNIVLPKCIDDSGFD
jgi:hypothetical protein